MKPEMAQEYTALLDRNDRDGAVKLVVGWLEQGKCGIAELYTEALLPGLQPDSCLLDQSEWCLWRDRIRNSITRTVVEACYPYVRKERDARRSEAGFGALVACPANESSDAAARMYADFFTLCGARADFIGTDVPCLDIASASSFMKSRFVCLVVDNPYNLTFLKEHCDAVRATRTFLPVIVVAGRAVGDNEEAVRKCGGRPAKSFDDIAALVREGMAKPEMRPGESK